MKLFTLCVTMVSTACAMSSGDKTLAGSLGLVPEKSVATLPGQIVLTRMPYPRKSSAMQAERPWRPHFEAQYRPPPLKALTPARELMLIISPLLRLIIEGATALETRNILFKLVFRTRSQSSSDFSCDGPKPPLPALFT